MPAKRLLVGKWKDDSVHSLRKRERAMSFELIAHVLTCGRFDDPEKSDMMAWRYRRRYMI